MAEPVYRNGRLIAWQQNLPDGEIVMLDPSGRQVIDAIDAAGQFIDPGEFEFEQGSEPAPRPPRSILDQIRTQHRHDRGRRLANLEADVFEPEEEDEEFDAIKLAAANDMADQVEARERMIGRPLTRPEQDVASSRAAEDFDAGRPIDVASSLFDAEAEGEVPGYDLDKDDDRRDFMVQRAKDKEAEARGDALGEPEPPRHDIYDPNNDEQRRDWMADALEGKLGDEPAAFLAAQE